MTREKNVRNLFKGLGSSPYLLALLKFIAAGSPNYTEIESYFRSVRRLHGYTEGLPTPKVVAFNLRTLSQYRLAKKEAGRWIMTSAAKPLLEFERMIEEGGEDRIYLWREASFKAGRNNNQVIEKTAEFLSAKHDFQNLNAIEPQTKLSLHALVRLNPGYAETVLLSEPSVAVCGLMYTLDDVKLSKIVREPLLMKISQQYESLIDFVYSHLASRLQHSISDLEHVLLILDAHAEWNRFVGIADYKTHNLRAYDIESKSYSRPENENMYHSVSKLRAVDHTCRLLSAGSELRRALSFLSNDVLALERELCELEFSRCSDQVVKRSLELIRDQLTGEQLPAKALKEAIMNIKLHIEGEITEPKRSENLLRILTSTGSDLK